jgi:secondary thiamine-phosphate synthase enzyme
MIMETIPVRTQRRNEFVDITRQVQKVIDRNGVKEGVCVVFVPHTTAGLTVNEHADPDVAADMLKTLGTLVPSSEDYAHSEGNSDAHIKASLMGSSVTVIVEEGRLRLGTWQGVFFAEFDGPRSREVWIKVIRA